MRSATVPLLLLLLTCACAFQHPAHGGTVSRPLRPRGSLAPGRAAPADGQVTEAAPADEENVSCVIKVAEAIGRNAGKEVRDGLNDGLNDAGKQQKEGLKEGLRDGLFLLAFAVVAQGAMSSGTPVKAFLGYGSAITSIYVLITDTGRTKVFGIALALVGRARPLVEAAVAPVIMAVAHVKRAVLAPVTVVALLGKGVQGVIAGLMNRGSGGDADPQTPTDDAKSGADAPPASDPQTSGSCGDEASDTPQPSKAQVKEREPSQVRKPMCPGLALSPPRPSLAR